MPLAKSNNILVTRSLNSEHLKYAKELNLSVTAKAFITVDLQELTEDTINRINTKEQSSWIFTSQNAVKSISDHIDNLINIKDKKVFAVGIKTAHALLDLGIKASVPKLHNSQSLIDLLETQSANSYIHFSGNLRQSNISEFMQEKEFEFEEIECYKTNQTQPDLEVSTFDAVCFCSPSAVVSFFSKYKIHEKIPCVAIGSTTAVKLLDYSEHVVMADNTNVYSLLEMCHNYINS
ncbi:MAG: uroporphyrinogen-III synthase [Labilibaculum sp.]|nr:uroporphyrinogen-III synthase [Labilibaculum sp.]MBI9059986.1 uroporphyrinogen-III synthase [Labilibaculum sp.]